MGPIMPRDTSLTCLIARREGGGGGLKGAQYAESLSDSGCIFFSFTCNFFFLSEDVELILHNPNVSALIINIILMY